MIKGTGQIFFSKCCDSFILWDSHTQKDYCGKCHKELKDGDIIEK